MDEIKEMLVKLMESQTEMKLDFSSRFDKMDSRLDKMDSRLDKMDSRFDKMDNRFDKMDNRFDKMDNRLDKIELNQEIVVAKLNTIAEMHTSHKEQNERAFQNTDALVDEKIDLLETSVKSVSKDVKAIKESVEVMKDVLGHHQIDIEILKRRPV